MNLGTMPSFSLMASCHTVPGTVVVFEAEMVASPDYGHLVTGLPWRPSGKLVALVHPEDLNRRPLWAMAAAERTRQALLHEIAAHGTRATAVVYREDEGPSTEAP